MNKLTWLLIALHTQSLYTVTHGHGILALPPSKNSGTLATSTTLDITSYFALASYGIIDKAYFDTNSVTPWNRPGDFTFEHARDLIPGHPQTLHPCGCNAGGIARCAGVEIASGFGERTLGAAPGVPTDIVPTEWERGSSVEVGWNAYANHAGGYIYTLCPKAKMDNCRDAYLPNGATGATQPQTDAYLLCVWTCFESNTLEWVPQSQTLQYADDPCTYVETIAVTKTGSDGRIWRESPIPDTAQVTNGNDGRCSWDAVKPGGFSSGLAEEKFTASFGGAEGCDTGPDNHGPKSWHIMDRVMIPSDIPVGEYVVSWRWDAYMADQMWTGCADVQIVSTPTPASAQSSTCPPTPSSRPTEVRPPTNPVAPVSSQPTTPKTCVDLPLGGNWGGGGAYNCDTYEDHGGDSYCAHSEIREGCCFCDGGYVVVDPTSSPVESSSAPSGAPVAVEPPVADTVMYLAALGIKSKLVNNGDKFKPKVSVAIKDIGKDALRGVEITLAWNMTKSNGTIKQGEVVATTKGKKGKTSKFKFPKVSADGTLGVRLISMEKDGYQYNVDLNKKDKESRCRYFSLECPLITIGVDGAYPINPSLSNP
eukprot:CAMPEP_0194358468 /NCGR_PEP_ID=MMETSP0174-20130528/5658_1 /TAXON_ID=216777 /ORGANISM="Proboscia alata, Strain PI-D3" /LENGTH=592 /DNA_ID=CAMNT_0039128783 /DNA_START=57 /DNA_END=1835 /DNA_ORIENTATION=+